MRKLLILFVSSGALATLGIPVLGVTAASAAGTPGNFDMELTSVGQVGEVTIGDFTVADVNNATTNGGCSGLRLFGSSKYWVGGGSLGGTWHGPLAAGTSIPLEASLGGGHALGSGRANILFQAVSQSTPSSVTTPSYITGQVGDFDGAALSTGIFPCLDLGNVSGG
jgi:hypothetical protein